MSDEIRNQPSLTEIADILENNGVPLPPGTRELIAKAERPFSIEFEEGFIVDENRIEEWKALCEERARNLARQGLDTASFDWLYISKFLDQAWAFIEEHEDGE